jgi:chemotaxis protein MotB
LPEEFTQPPPVLPPKSEPPQDTASQAKFNELNQRIAELEALLTEARNAPPPVVDHDALLPREKTEVKSTIPLPIINKQGVHVYADELKKVRIAIMDKSLFMSNTWQLSAEGEETLRTIAAEIRAADAQTILDIEGHTDSLMSDPNNPMQKHDISSTKSMAVMKFFVDALRWDAARIGTSSFGRSRPVADNGTPEGRARNNRIEIVVQRETE